ncbi:MAG: hypothetical protein KBC35_02885 [Candidatus Pacebacteria bacterium]|nr:hypothetical protein [Candidatus Paceibacterota bacterium]
MKTAFITRLTQPMFYAIVASVVIVTLLLVAFFTMEPRIGHAVDSNDFRIRQTITDETSFLVQPSNVTMIGSISGVTGGTANGSTTFAVISNNADGYTVSIAYENNPGLYAMRGDTTDSEAIRDYSGTLSGGMQPSYNFTASTAAQFAYTVDSTTDGDTDQSFRDNGSACNQAGGTGNSLCWMAPSTTAYTIVDRGSSANTGATSTISFRVVVPSGSDPAVTADTYTATATLTLLAQ